MKHLHKKIHSIKKLRLWLFCIVCSIISTAVGIDTAVGSNNAVGSLQLPTQNEVKSKTFTHSVFQVTNLKQHHTQLKLADSTIVLDKATGLIVSQGLDLVTAHCTGCHSSKLITQFRTDRKGWLEKIRWMQQKQKLWDLGEAEPKILDYLAKNYPPTEKVNRRAALKNIDWYKLK